jgi:hypothetical protein
MGRSILPVAHLPNPDGELRTEQLAQMTPQTGLGSDEIGWMISLCIETVRGREDVAGTELDAVVATLAALFPDAHLTTGAKDLPLVEGGPPETLGRDRPSHGPPPERHDGSSRQGPIKQVSKIQAKRAGDGGKECPAPGALPSGMNPGGYFFALKSSLWIS